LVKKSINFHLDEEVKEEAEKLFSELGLSIEEALNIFIKRSIREKGIPYRTTMNVENKEEGFEYIYVEALRELIEKGYSGKELIEKFKKSIGLIKIALQNMREESEKIASGEIEGVSFEEIF